MRNTTATRATKRGQTHPVVVQQALEGAAPTVKRRGRAAADKEAVYVKALTEAEAFHKRSFFIEMAVCLAFYTEREGTDKDAKKALRPIYERAGYDCKNPAGEDYKTVQRRISVAADLYNFLGQDLHTWYEGKTGTDRIHAIAEQLEEQELDSISAVQTAAGKPTGKRKYTKRTPQAQPPVAPPPVTELDKEVAALVAAGMQTVVPEAGQPLPSDRLLKTEHMVVAIPFEATKEEVMKLAMDLLNFAQSMTAAAEVKVPEPAAT